VQLGFFWLGGEKRISQVTEHRTDVPRDPKNVILWSVTVKVPWECPASELQPCAELSVPRSESSSASGCSDSV